MSRVIVVGSGAAGLLTALRLADGAEVVLITKGVLGEGSTAWAQGGIAAATGPDDSPALHAADTIGAGAGLTDPDAALLLAEAGPDRIADLVRLGLALDGGPASPHRGLEAAHSVPRVLHVGGDATGAGIAAVLVDAVRRAPVTVLEHTAALDLVLEQGRVRGLLALIDGDERLLTADRVVLATGGAGQLFSHTTNPAGATADGVALAARAGAVLADLEFLQFHPTALAVPGSPLVSEAVRGEGAVLLDAEGRRFLPAVHPLAELAPRDVVARAVADAMAKQGGAPVLLDARAVPDLRRRFPTIDAVVRAAGLDWTREPVPVTPAAHYWMGGVATDGAGRTTVPGLWAVGEVARTGVHGANRLASNSLLEALVLADRCAAAILAGDDAPAVLSAVDVPLAAEPDPAAPAFSRAALQTLLWVEAGLARDERGLRRAAGVLAAWRAAAAPVRTAADAEDAALLLAGALLVDAALTRRESRGAHLRTDHPAPDPAQARSRFVRPALAGAAPELATAGGAAWR